MGSISGNCCTCSLADKPFWYTSGGKMGVSVYGKLGTSLVRDWKTWRTVVSTSVVGFARSLTSFVQRSPGSSKLISTQARFQANGFLKPLVCMSAAILEVTSYIRTSLGFLKCSCMEVMEIPCVLSRCLIVGSLPDLTTPIIPWLSSWNSRLGDFPVNVSQMLSSSPL